MELFRNRILKNMYKNFVSNTIFMIFKCKYCNLESCTLHYKFDCSCKNCRIIKCKECHNFNVELDILMQGASQEARLYILNFVRDFFAISNITLKFFYGFSSKTEISIENIHEITWDLRKFHGTKKGKAVEPLSKTMSFIVKINKSKKGFIYKL